MKYKILAVDDDPDLLATVKDVLASGPYIVETAENGEKALRCLSGTPPDLAILDWKLPDLSGLQILRQIRSDPKTAAIPVLMLTTLSDVRNKVEGLAAGADDYLPKPFHLAELRARVEALIRRHTRQSAPAPTLEIGALTLDIDRGRAALFGRDLSLTRAEFDILHLLAAGTGKLQTRSFLESRALSRDLEGGTRPLDVHLSRLRTKLGPAWAKGIETVRGVGYIFTPPDEPSK